MRQNERLVPACLSLVLFAGLSGIAVSQEPVRDVQAEPELVVPAGTVLPIILGTFLNSRSSQVGDTFYADTAYPIWIQQRLAIPRGSTIRGTVTTVQRPGRIKGKGKIGIRFESVLLPNGVSRDLVAVFKGIHGPGNEKIDHRSESVQMDGTAGADAGTVIGSTGQGALFGGIGGRSGASTAIGAGAGAVVGLATVLISRGPELILAPGTQFDVELKQPLRFAYGELQFTAGQMDSGRRSTPPTGPRYDRSHDHRPYFGGRLPFPIPWYTPWP